MRTRLLAILVIPAVIGCGPPEPATDKASTPTAGAAAGTAETAPAPASKDSESPCSALAAPPVRYEAAGKPVAYTFEYPSGWTVNELFSSGATSLDVVKSVDDDTFPEFILRFGHVVDKEMDNVENLVGTWRKLAMIEEILEIDIEGRTMYVAKSRIGEMTGFQALFPDVRSDSKAWLVSGGVTSAPKGCKDEAIAAVEQIIRSFAPNPDIGPPPTRN